MRERYFKNSRGLRSIKVGDKVLTDYGYTEGYDNDLFNIRIVTDIIVVPYYESGYCVKTDKCNTFCELDAGWFTPIKDLNTKDFHELELRTGQNLHSECFKSQS